MITKEEMSLLYEQIIDAGSNQDTTHELVVQFGKALQDILITRIKPTLEFYSSGKHIQTITGIRCDGSRIYDWDLERIRLEDQGYSMVCESYNGHETFVEYGEQATALLEELE